MNRRKTKSRTQSPLSAALTRWELEYRNAANADKNAVLKKHLREHGLPNKPKRLLEGTIMVVQTCAAYACMEGRSFTEFINMQRYFPKADHATYAVTLSFHGRAFSRVLVPRNIRVSEVDFADLYAHPWYKFKVVGFDTAWISRVDGRRLSRKEVAELDKLVTSDLNFDYTEDEIDFWFDDLTLKGKLMIAVQDHEPEDDAHEELSGRYMLRAIRWIRCLDLMKEHGFPGRHAARDCRLAQTSASGSRSDSLLAATTSLQSDTKDLNFPAIAAHRPGYLS